ncbi:unnamed protein product [Cyprideis torosa]|uniref:5'-nucleotidase n=1 Tax=Cyprideis torosa TaxID=163714 RepID=A0A7R8ZVE8_9CRUS|nr:unnamed protein product [Cyprideis torosa]CAG0902580.1 unnamed protein product [Cyprideis torosa]
MEMDAVAFGNHDFDKGTEQALAFASRSTNFTLLAANMKAEEGEALGEYYEPYTIIQRGGRRIGIVGYVTDLTCFNGEERTEGITFECETPAVERTVQELQSQGIDIIIALGHSGFHDYDEILAQSVEGIDLIVGGHSHTFMYNGNPPVDPSDGQEADVEPMYPMWTLNNDTLEQDDFHLPRRFSFETESPALTAPVAPPTRKEFEVMGLLKPSLTDRCLQNATKLIFCERKSSL